MIFAEYSEEVKFWKYFAAVNVIGGGSSSWIVSAVRHVDQYEVSHIVLQSAVF